MKKHTERVIASILQSKEQLKKIIATYFVVTCGLFLFLLFFVWQDYQGVLTTRRNELKLLEYWEVVLLSHPNYPDAYYQSSLHAARVGDKQKALEYINKALDLDPYFQRAEDLKKELIGG